MRTTQQKQSLINHNKRTYRRRSFILNLTIRKICLVQVTRSKFHQRSTSTSTDPESAKKDSQVVSLFCAFEIWCQFHQRSTYSFCARQSQKHKKYT